MVTVERMTEKAITTIYSIPLPATNGQAEGMLQQARSEMKEHGLRPGADDELELDHQDGNLTATWSVTIPDDATNAEGLMAPEMENILASALFLAANPDDSWSNPMIPDEVKATARQEARELLGRMSAAWVNPTE